MSALTPAGAALSAALNAGTPEAAERDLRDACAALDASTERLRSAAQRVANASNNLRSRLDRVSQRQALSRSVIVVDDSPEALLALVMALRDVGAPLHAVTHDRRVVSALTAQGVTAHLVRSYDEAPGLIRRYRCAVAIVDVHLGDANGAELVERLHRGPRVILVTSHHDARDSLVDAARATQSEAVIRTDTGQWVDALRARVSDALRSACG